MAHACACGGEKEFKIGEEIPRLPYETMYQRCKCGIVGLTPEVWAILKDSSGVCRVVTAGGWHSPDECPIPYNVPHDVKVLAMKLGDPLPGEEKIK